ncbi:MAG: NTP transferase domain-containing protein [Cyclobacteriaceae bacterium]|nr:NTP transferase domain-containing protein [Cyclobacteriaceae bacterium HetDA_MAG_MS6]
MGPLGGIVSAFQQYPNRAFLVLACDMPLVDELTISALAANRQKEVDCTSYRLKNSKYFEATFTIYEYSAFEYMKRRQEAGQYGLQAIIGHLKHHVVEPANEQVFVNVNDQQSLEYVQQLLGRKLLD